jgi:hypothetical protein
MSTRLQPKHEGRVSLAGGVQLHVIRGRQPGPPRAQTTMEWLRRALREGLPTMAVEREVRRWRVANLRYLSRGMRQVLLARALKLPVFHGALWLTPIYADGRRVELGLVGLRVVTTAGVGFLVDALQNLLEPEIMKYHGIGTGSTAENASDTALVTELTTEYNPDNTRATGNLAEGASANIFHTEATNTLDGTPGAALREHCVFSQAATGGGTALDRTVYAAITLSAGDGLLSKYELTLNSGG